METDYHKIGMSIADSIGVATTPLTDDQRTMLVGALSPWLLQRDERISVLVKGLREVQQDIRQLLNR